MKGRKIFSVVIACLFVALILVSSYFALSVNNISIEFEMCDEDISQIYKIKDDLAQFEGVNLLSVKEETLEAIIEKDPYMEVLSIEKKLPGKIIIKARERREAFMVTHGEKYFLLDEEGFVLTEYLGDERRDLVKVELVDIDVVSVDIGGYIVTENDQAVKNAFEIAKSVNLTDCIKVMTIEDKFVQTDIVFDTYTSVKIRIMDSGERGKDKAEKAFAVYDAEQKDYIKSFNELQAYLFEDKPVAVWTRYVG